jgi:hypothetical protein
LFGFAALFKIQHWPGAGIVFIASWFSVAVLFLPLLLLNILRQDRNRVNTFFSIILVTSFISILLMALARNPRKNTLESMILSEQSMVSNAIHLDRQSDRLLNVAMTSGSGEAVSSLKAISAEADRICSFIQSAKKDMVLIINEENRAAILENDQIDFQNITGLESDFPPAEVMFGSPDHKGKASELKSMLESFHTQALSLTTNEELKSFINEQLGLSVPSLTNKSWEECYFNGPMLQIAGNLSSFQLKIRMVESDLLRELSDRIKAE